MYGRGKVQKTEIPTQKLLPPSHWPQRVRERQAEDVALVEPLGVSA